MIIDPTLSSKSVEWYTPPEIVDVVRRFLGGIDLDPASCEAANATIRADRYYTREADGLLQTWQGRVFCNPPYGRDPGVGSWVKKAIAESKNGASIIMLVNSCTGEGWFQSLFDYPVCFVSKRIKFIDSAGERSQPTKSNALVWIDERASVYRRSFTREAPSRRFLHAFCQTGAVFVPEPFDL